MFSANSVLLIKKVFFFIYAPKCVHISIYEQIHDGIEVISDIELQNAILTYIIKLT